MRTTVSIILAVAAIFGLAGCNPEDANSLKTDTQKLGRDIVPILSNGTLQTKVNAHLSLHKGVDMSGLHIDTRDKVVTVSGHVRDAHMRQVVIGVVKETTGVEKVVDKLEIQKP